MPERLFGRIRGYDVFVCLTCLGLLGEASSDEGVRVKVAAFRDLGSRAQRFGVTGLR